MSTEAGAPGRVAGRARELELLAQALDEAADGVPRAVVVRGEAGVGKTRLVSAVCDRARWLAPLVSSRSPTASTISISGDLSLGLRAPTAPIAGCPDETRAIEMRDHTCAPCVPPRVNHEDHMHAMHRNHARLRTRVGPAPPSQ